LTEATAYGEGLEIDDPVFGINWTKYWGTHSWLYCDVETACICEGRDCGMTHEIQEDTPAAAETAKTPPIPLVIIEPPTLTLSKLNLFNWHR